MHPTIAIFLLTLSTIPPPALSEIRDVHISDDPRPSILFERFGFANGGHATISLEKASWRFTLPAPGPDPDPSSMGFFLVKESLYPRIVNESEYVEAFCPLFSRYVDVLFKLDVLAGGKYNTSISIVDPDEYSLVFANCLQNPISEVTMDVHTEMYNVGRGGGKDFLPAGQTRLPEIYVVSSMVYVALFVVWVAAIVRQRATAEKIHMIMAALLVFKALRLVCAAENMWHVKRTGTAHGWDVAFYVFSFFKGVTLFTVIVLIGTGWSFLKPYLQEREKKVLMVVIPLQVLENIAYVVLGEAGPAARDWLTWIQLFLLLDVLCCCAVFFPIIWSIRSLREASRTDGKAARNLAKLTLFRQFYVVVVGYLYFTRIVVTALGALLSYRYTWVVTALVETASLAFYLFVFYNFQPIEKNPYLFIGDEEEAGAAAAALELEEQNVFAL